MRLTTLVLILLSLNGCFKSNPEDFTVKITNLARSSGGSGSIVFSSPDSASVLTNGHVCEVVRSGGYVTSNLGEGIVVDYRISKQHDLCLIDVSSSLGEKSTHLSPTPPRKFDDEVVSGHPRLLPTIITKGQFSEKQIIQVTIGFRDCTQGEIESPETGLFCVVVGKLPIIKAYESIIVSSLIQPGSSGSAVYNSLGEITAVIFAGSGEIGYGMAVPHEYIAEFLYREVQDLKKQQPDMYVQVSTKGQSSRRDSTSKMEEACQKKEMKDLKVCTLINETLKFNDLVQR